MSHIINPKIVETWIKGWTLARETAVPVAYKGGFAVEVGWEKQLRRYVFPAVGISYKHIAETVYEPWVFLKVCAPPQDVSTLLPPRWSIQPPGFMMVCNRPMRFTSKTIPEGYILNITDNIPVPVASILNANGEIAAIGRVAFVEGFAIYDRIETHPEHRRVGLASFIMKSLEAIAVSRNITKGILVATTEGKALYETLGWEMYSVYTSAVIIP